MYSRERERERAEICEEYLIINFRFQLKAQYFISVTMLLYMFRALLRPSSGGPLRIYNICLYVSLCLVTVRLEG